MVALAQSWTDGVCDCVIVMISGLIVAQGRQRRYSMSRHSKATAKRASGKLAFVHAQRNRERILGIT